MSRLKSTPLVHQIHLGDNYASRQRLNYTIHFTKAEHSFINPSTQGLS